ncbi:MAG: hypothetical protein G5701_08800 [Serratia symbiotica]|nr:hypothetical protein [Serratia symbiotica]
MSDTNLRLQVLLSAVDKVTRPFRSMQASNKALAASVKATQEQLKNLDKAGANLANFKALQSSSKNIASALDSARLKGADDDARAIRAAKSDEEANKSP